jgi:hypothetical protein
LTTRPVHIVGYDHLIVMAPSALEGMINQVRTKFVSMSVEHLTFLPPIGRWYDGEIVEASDGAKELILRGKELPQLVPREHDPSPLSEADALPAFAGSGRVTMEVAFEARNFDPDVVAEINETCPLPTKEELRWSSLPPIEWVLSIPVLWGAIKFGGAFFDELGHASARALVDWIRGVSNKAHEPNRDRLITLAFDIDDDRVVYAIIPVAAQSENPDQHGDDSMRALDSAGQVATFAGLVSEGRCTLGDVRRAAFIFDAGQWQLAWWTDGNQVYRTKWFEQNSPDPSRFLGRHLLPDDLNR